MNKADEIRDDESRVAGVIFALLILAYLLLACALIFGGVPEFSRDEPGASEWAGDAIVSAIFLFALAAMIWLAQPARIAVDELADAAPLCSGCLDPYREGVHFCPHCAAPLTWFAATAWYETVYAQAWCLGRAAHGPSRPVHVVGLGMKLGAEVVTFVVILASSTSDFPPLAAAYYAPIAVAWLALWGTLLWRCIRNLDATDPDQLDPDRGPYGSPPWWTYDRDWALPEPPAEEAVAAT